MLGTSDHNSTNNNNGCGVTNHSDNSPNGHVMNGQVNGDSMMGLTKDDEPLGVTVKGSATLSRNAKKTADDKDTYNLCWKEFASNLGSFFR